MEGGVGPWNHVGATPVRAPPHLGAHVAGPDKIAVSRSRDGRIRGSGQAASWAVAAGVGVGGQSHWVKASRVRVSAR